ncbi:MAG: DUF3810 family protein [Bacteroidota bacterium]
MSQKDSNISWKVTLAPVLLAAISLLLRWAVPADWIEQVYSRGIFPVFRTVWDALITSWFPIPLLYVFWALVIFGIVQWIRGTIRRKRSKGWGSALVFAASRLVQFVAWVVVAFLWLWGFNYGRQSVEEVLDFRRYSPDSVALASYVYNEAQSLAALRKTIIADSSVAFSHSDLPADWMTITRQMLEDALAQEGYPTTGKVRIRQLWPKGILLRFSTAGVYWPWVGEGNADGGLTALQLPGVVAHEMAHGYGFGDEGTCNFWSVLTGFQATDPALEYVFRLDYWRRMAGRLRRAQPRQYFAWRQHSLYQGIKTDLEHIYTNSQKYPDIMPRFRTAFYDTYLRTQGISEGILSYGLVIQMVEGYKRRE